MLAAATLIGSLGLAAGGTAAALLAVEMTSSEAAAGLPLGALAAGRGRGLAAGRPRDRPGRAAPGWSSALQDRRARGAGRGRGRAGG